MIKKLFISQPMKGKTDDEILKTRNAAIEKATALIRGEYGPDAEVVVLDSFFRNAPAGAKPLWYLAKSIELLAEADVAYFCKEFYTARGCKVERNCAEDYRIPMVIKEYDDLTEVRVLNGSICKMTTMTDTSVAQVPAAEYGCVPCAPDPEWRPGLATI